MDRRLTMDWEARVNGSVSARALPVRSLEIPLTLVWKGQGDAEIQAIEWWGSFVGYPGLDLPLIVQAVGPEWLTRPASNEAAILLRCLVDARFIQQLEERRNGGGPVTMELLINVRFRLLCIQPWPRESAGEHSTAVVGSLSHPLRKQVQTRIVIQRD